MENVKVPENKNAPFIKRTINGQEFTVLIHFRAGCRCLLYTSPSPRDS